MKIKKSIIIESFLLQLAIFLMFGRSITSVSNIFYGMSFKTMPLVIFTTILMSCMEVLAILVPIKDVWNLENMVKIRTSKKQYFKLLLMKVSPYVLLIIVLNIGVSLWVHSPRILIGSIRILLDSLVCIFIADKYKNNKNLFFLILGIVLISRLILTFVSPL